MDTIIPKQKISNGYNTYEVMPVYNEDIIVLHCIYTKRTFLNTPEEYEYFVKRYNYIVI